MATRSARVTPSGLTSAIGAILDDFGREEVEGAKRAVRKGARAAVDELRAGSPKESGEYASGWRASVSGQSGAGLSMVVHNAAKPSLTHLLELGHRQFWMGHDTGRRTPGIPHIDPAAKAAEAAMEEALG